MLRASPACPVLLRSGLCRSFGQLPKPDPRRPRALGLRANRAMGDASTASGDLRPGAAPPKKVLFFDIDNCLYPKSARVHDLMAKLIDEYFARHLKLPWDEAVRLHKEYYQNYGLAIEGLVRHHEIDPLEYNAQVDDALPLDGVIVPNPRLKQLLRDIDRSQVRLWLFTNAYVTHGRRVVHLLEVEDQFEGITYCDYGTTPLVCKPHKDAFAKAMREAGVDRVDDCFFVDDSYINCKSAKELGWTAAHLVEEGVAPSPATPASQFQIGLLDELRTVFPQFFHSDSQQQPTDGA